ncbi:MAG: hypothetical protein EOM67_08540 [Spirochaetia bacterium]|nr:hypothetical protein [Spirochaetia bacterium]
MIIDIEIVPTDCEHVMEIYCDEVLVTVYKHPDYFWAIYTGTHMFMEGDYNTIEELLESVANIYKIEQKNSQVDIYREIRITIDNKYDGQSILPAILAFQKKYGFQEEPK